MVCISSILCIYCLTIFGNPLAYFALNLEIVAANAQGFDEFIKKLTAGQELKDLHFLLRRKRILRIQMTI
jgi:hypothetical protein